ncbi:MAG: TetR/AcrR family transcriptional regulator [Candidatus Melainabacteria bacterium]|jgi:TetR/AcrR family transcriptional repressor of nem operon|nr:TetR/AcrR family transcriptional regulator [Candidatus Melainabacteria bacterium]
MARPREFDIEEALDAAISTFWEHGYEATSMDDLLNAMGLTKGSLYKAFGDKHNLFLLSLQDYLDHLFERMKETVDSDSDPVQALNALMGLVEELCCKQTTARGCFAVNTVVELSQRDGKAGEILKKHLIRVEKLLAKLISHGQESGDFRVDMSAEHLAESLFVYIFGMLAQSRGITNQARARRLSTFALAMLQAA